MNTEDPSNTPKYFSLLNQQDKEGYRKLQTVLLQATEKRHRGHRLDIFLDCLDQIHRFSQRGEEDDWKRCCVCGVCFLKCGIALNSHQMKFLTNKCKSSINGALKMMKYKTTSARGDINPELVDFLPILKGNTNELRQWSVRTPENYSPPPINKSPYYQDNFLKDGSYQLNFVNSNSNNDDNNSNTYVNNVRLLSGSEEEEVTDAVDISNTNRSLFTVALDNKNNETGQLFSINTKPNLYNDQRIIPNFKSSSVIITDGDVHIIGTDKYYNSLSSNPAASNCNFNSLFTDFSKNDLNVKAALSLDDFDIVPSHCLNEINDNSELIEISCFRVEKPKELFEETPFLEI